MVLSLLSQNQTQTMNSLSKNLAPTVPWSGSEPCAWKGVSCDSANSSVVGISLSGFSLPSSDFLPLVCKIETLEHLDVSRNHLSSIPDGFITECGKIKGLKLLNFSVNKVGGVLPTFHGFEALETLDMSFNDFGGNIGLEIDGLVSLKILNLTFNEFNGSLPTKLGKSMALEHLLLSNNSFDGKIPDELLSYENLTWIDLKNNKLSQSIPVNIGKLSKLDTLILSANNLNGEIPTSLVNITKLSRFAASENKFTGSIPSGITKYLISLDLSYNYLSGAIPEDLLSPPQLQVLDLTDNKLNGSLPTKVSPNLFRLRLGSNQLSGNIPSDAFVGVHNLTYLELDNNILTGSIPAELGSCRSLTLLNLAQNQLSGVLPQELGNLTNLHVLQLQYNNLNGTIPTQIGQLSKLLTLNLSSNSLGGSIPSDIANLSRLNFLYLQGNNLSGSIPTSIGNLGVLLELQLGENRLGGVIPEMSLVNLQVALNLSSNLFRGPIPSSFSSLINLEILDLSNNRFSGQIPDYLTGLQALTRLILSYNPLSGEIPNFTHNVIVEYLGTDLKNTTAHDNRIATTVSKSRISVAVAIVIAIVAAIFLVGLVTLLVVSVSRHYYRVNDEHSQSGEDRQHPQVIMQSNFLTPNGMHRSNIDFSKAMEAVAETSNVTLKTRFSTYYMAVMPSGSIYYVKKLNWFDKIFQVGSHDKFVKELEVLAKLNNSNVMTPLAYVLSSDTAYILYEYISNGSLFDVLHGNMDLSLDWASRYSIAVGVAQGLSFLHGFTSSPILLLDLSSKSIMLKSLKEPLVGDIEHYKVIDPSKSTGNFSAVAGSVGYIPPGI